MKALCYLWCRQNSKVSRRSTLIVRPKYAQKIKKAHAQQNKYPMVRKEVKISRQNDFFCMKWAISGWK